MSGDALPVFYLLELLVIGGITGLLSGMLGVGGGFVLVPLLTLAGVDIKLAIGTSLAYIVATAASGALRHMSQGTVDVALAASIVIVAALTAQAGAWMGESLEGPVLTAAFGVMLIAVALWFLFGPNAGSRETAAREVKGWLRFVLIERRRRVNGKELVYYIDLRKGAVVGTIVGFASGLFGVGGGFLMVPMVVMWMTIPVPVAVGSDLIGVILTATSGVIAHHRLGNIDFSLLIPLIVGGMIMAQVGARLAVRLSQRSLRFVFVAILALAAVNMLYSGVAELFFDISGFETGE